MTVIASIKHIGNVITREFQYNVSSQGDFQAVECFDGGLPMIKAGYMAASIHIFRIMEIDFASDYIIGT
jgi:hypothetical protein